MDLLINTKQTMLLKTSIMKRAQKVFWIIRRLKLMSLQEIFHRFQSATVSIMEKFGFLTAVKTPKFDLSVTSEPWITNTSKFFAASPIPVADQLVAGTIDIFALQNIKLGIPHCWNTDPKTGTKAPLIFGKAINYRDCNVVGDVKYLWELNRHLEFVALAQAYVQDSNPTYLKTLRIQLTSWFDQCPYPIGINWTSSLELGIRLINWSITWQLLGGHRSEIFEDQKGKELKERWLTSIYQHAHFINRNYSRYSSANNHLIGEASGLFVASQTWPYWDKMAEWAIKAKTILEYECLEQSFADGVNREQTVSYQQFVLDFLILAGIAGRASDVKFSDTYWNRIETMVACIAAFLDVNGNMPMIGDADDGFVVKLSHEDDFCPYRSIVATGALLFNRSDFATKSEKVDDKTRWLLGIGSDHKFESLLRKKYPPHFQNTFSEGGYYIFGKHFNSSKEIKGIIDCGPLGYLSIAAHGHADALSFTLNICGQEFLVDPGTYVYHTNLDWRDYFKGTAAHNTARIDRVDQSVIGGSFMWLKKAQSTCEQWESNTTENFFVGSHDGYTHLDDPVIHRRTIIFLKEHNHIRVNDHFLCRGRHTVERYWHFHEKCELVHKNRSLSVRRGNVSVSLQSKGGWQSVPKVVKGESKPICGWISRRLDYKEPTTTIIWTDQINGSTVLTTDFNINLASETQ